MGTHEASTATYKMQNVLVLGQNVRTTLSHTLVVRKCRVVNMLTPARLKYGTFPIRKASEQAPYRPYRRPGRFTPTQSALRWTMLGNLPSRTNTT